MNSVEKLQYSWTLMLKHAHKSKETTQHIHSKLMGMNHMLALVDVPEHKELNELIRYYATNLSTLEVHKLLDWQKG